jgi:Flp pilus assembly protein TadB
VVLEGNHRMRMDYLVVWIIFFACVGVIAMILSYLKVPPLIVSIVLAIVGMIILIKVVSSSRVKKKERKERDDEKYISGSD